MGANGATTRSAAPGDRWRSRAAAVRIAVIILALGGVAAIHPWRSVDNAGEVARVQAVVDAMSGAVAAIRSGAVEVARYSVAVDGFAAATVATGSGATATVLVGPAGEDCVFVHWLPGRAAQAGLLLPGRPCGPEAITEVPLRTHAGYVPGTGPPFDVTPLVQERWTPIWYLVALIGFGWLAIRAGLDLFTIGLRPDHVRDGRT